MARRSILKGIAAGTAQKFISRYTEIDGYWALGKLYRFAFENGSNDLTLWLWPNRSRNLKGTRPLAKQFENYVLARLSQVNIDPSYVTSAALQFEFGIESGDEWTRIPKTWGEKYWCRAVIIDHLGYEYKFKVRGWCGKHDQTTESQSAQIS